MALELVGGTCDGTLLNEQEVQRLCAALQVPFLSGKIEFSPEGSEECEVYIIEGDKAIEQNLYRGMNHG